MYDLDHIPLECVKVKCKYANRKPIYDLLFDSNSNVYPRPICNGMRDNSMRTFETLSNEIFELTLEGQGQGQDEQRGVLHRNMANCVAYNLLEEMHVHLKPCIYGPPSNRTSIHYICSVMLDGKFSLEL